MKIMIVGAGVIGTVYGWALSEAGHSVTHLIRPGRASNFTNGVSLDLMDRRKNHKKWFSGNYAIKVIETLAPANDFEMVIIPVKHYSLEDVLKQIVPLSPHADFLLLTQNWKGTVGIDNILESSQYIFGDAKAGGCFKDGKLVGTIYAIDLGCADNKQNAGLKKAQDLFRSADIKTTLQDNILHYLWVQYAINGGFWPPLVHAGSIKATLRDSRLVNMAFLGIKECLTVVRTRGVDLHKYPETDIYFTNSVFIKMFGIAVMKAMFRFNKYVKRNSAHALADPKEIKTFYYDLINTGAELGIAMPVMASFKTDIDSLKMHPDL
ncbi:MAG: ketopantoate reductase family protein [Sphingobacteriales bacterium]